MTAHFAIVVSGATADERIAIQAIIRDSAQAGWWHRFPDLWLVGGGTAAEWRDIVVPALTGPSSSALVLKIDTDDPGAWAFVGRNADEKVAWLQRQL